MAERLLDLSTKVDRKTIRIDSVDYQVRSVNDLTIGDHQTIEVLWPRIAALMATSDTGAIKPKDATELRTLLRQACRMALLAPETVIKAQGDLNLTLIFDAFLRLLSPTLQEARAKLLEARPTTPAAAVVQAGTRSFHASRASTASGRRSGSGTSRRA